jgi:hypothetical protein
MPILLLSTPRSWLKSLDIVGGRCLRWDEARNALAEIASTRPRGLCTEADYEALPLELEAKVDETQVQYVHTCAVCLTTITNNYIGCSKRVRSALFLATRLPSTPSRNSD